MKKNLAEKYFGQKNWTVFETVCLAAAVLFMMIATFIDYGGPIGLPLAVLSVIVFVVYRTSKVSDAEMDALLNKIMEGKVDTKAPEQVIGIFDFRKRPIRKGKDGKVRSAQYVVSCFSFTPCSTEIKVYTIDLISGNVEEKSYSVPRGETVSLTEDWIQIGDAKKKMQQIESKTLGLSLPVSTDDVNASKIIEKICAN